MSEPEAGALQPIQLLLVDDDDVDVKLTLRALASDRVINHVNVVHDGVEAMAYLRREGQYANAVRPDLIFLDLNMPRMDGREVLREIKADKDFGAIPVIVLTTSDADEDVVRSYKEHANSYITKPIDMAQFRHAIRALEQYWFAVVKLPGKD